MITVERLDAGAGAVCAAILATLPSWFGMPEANAEYARVADANPTFVATADAPVGLTTITRFGDYAAEVHLMAVVPKLHRGGVGRTMLEDPRLLRGDGLPSARGVPVVMGSLESCASIDQGPVAQR